MKQDVYIAGVGMTQFGKHVDRSLKELAGEAITAALVNSGLDKRKIEAAYMGSAAASVITGQVCIPGQVVLRSLGIGRIPVVNVENACATGATAFNQACAMITLGLYDIVLACGFDKLYHVDKKRTFDVLTGAVDVDELGAVLDGIRDDIEKAGFKPNLDGAASTRSLFMDLYAVWAMRHMKKYGTTREQFAAVSAKNSHHGSLNPRAQYRKVLNVEDVLAAREVSWPLTLPMCSPIGDGAAAVILVSKRKSRELGIRKGVRVASSVLASGWDYNGATTEQLTGMVAKQAYEEAGVGPQDLSCAEVHDASAPSEIFLYEHLKFCLEGEGGRLVEDGHTRLGGRLPVNTSGGLLRKGHPIGATGIAQIVELTEQLRGGAGARQVQGARIGLAENGGGYIGCDAAAMAVSILMT